MPLSSLIPGKALGLLLLVVAALALVSGGYAGWWLETRKTASLTTDLNACTTKAAQAATAASAVQSTGNNMAAQDVARIQKRSAQSKAQSQARLDAFIAGASAAASEPARPVLSPQAADALNDLIVIHGD